MFSLPWLIPAVATGIAAKKFRDRKRKMDDFNQALDDLYPVSSIMGSGVDPQKKGFKDMKAYMKYVRSFRGKNRKTVGSGKIITFKNTPPFSTHGAFKLLSDNIRKKGSLADPYMTWVRSYRTNVKKPKYTPTEAFDKLSSGVLALGGDDYLPEATADPVDVLPPRRRRAPNRYGFN